MEMILDSLQIDNLFSEIPPLPPIEPSSEYDPFQSQQEEYEPVPIIMDDEDADRIIRKYKQAEERKQRCISVAARQIARLQEVITEAERDFERETWNMLPQLNAYLDQVPAKETKTMKSFQLPAGKIIRKLEKEDFQKDDAALLKYLQENEPEYIEQVPKIKWGEFKKRLTIQEGTVLEKDTGVVLDCIKTVVHPSSIEIK